MQLKRIFKHFFYGSLAVKCYFPKKTLERITSEITKSEKKHAGQIRFAVEHGLHIAPLLHGQTSRTRAHEVFSNLGVWDTEHNSGVLIYVLLADRSVEIVADRGINAKVTQAQWDAICRDIENYFRQKEFEKGALTGIEQISNLLIRHFPGTTSSGNELPDTAVVI
jgi:uncharacterized membrane protein